MDASCIQVPSFPASCAVKIMSFKNTKIDRVRKGEMGSLCNSSHEFDPGLSAFVDASTIYFAGLPKVNPSPVVKTTFFFLLPGTGWLTYWSRKDRLAVNQPFNLLAIPAVKFTR